MDTLVMKMPVGDMTGMGDMGFWTEEQYFGGLLQEDNCWQLSNASTFNEQMDELFAAAVMEGMEGSNVPQLLDFEPTRVESAANDEERSSGDELDEVDDGGPEGPTADEIATWQREVVEVGRERVWRDQRVGKRLQSRCFAVEWRSSMLIDKDDFVRRLLGVVGGEASFVLGTERRTSRADYFLIVRLFKRMRWRDWRESLMFGHGDCGDEEGLFMRVRVPRRKTDEAMNLFVKEMVTKCEMYDETCRYKEAQLTRLQKRRTGAKAKA